MKLFFRIFIVLYCLWFLKGCFGLFYLKMTHLSDDELTWITNPMKKHRRGIFESDSGHRATLDLLDYGISNKQDPFYFNVVESDIYQAKGVYSILVTLPTGSIDGYFYIIKSAENDSLIFNAKLSWCYTDKYMYDTSDTTLRDREFKNCVVLDSTNSSYHKDTQIRSFIINKTYGLIYFELISGEKYYRKFKSSDDSLRNNTDNQYTASLIAS